MKWSRKSVRALDHDSQHSIKNILITSVSGSPVGKTAAESITQWLLRESKKKKKRIFMHMEIFRLLHRPSINTAAINITYNDFDSTIIMLSKSL